jgi:hypothetical protein
MMKHRARQRCRFACRLATICIVCLPPPSAGGQLRPNHAALAAAPPELINRLRADPFTYFRFINRAWTERVCQAFADVQDLPIVRLHGDAHVEQFAVTKDGWGLDDFDDSARGPVVIDLVRFLGSIDLATRQRGWTRDRDALWDRFLDGYRRGLVSPDSETPEPDIVRSLRLQAPLTRTAYLAWGERLMQRMDQKSLNSVMERMSALERFMRGERPDLAPGYFTVVRAGWLRLGVGSAAAKKVLIRVQGPSLRPEDDELIEAKEVANLDGVGCLEAATTPQAVRVISGSRQLGRIRHNILAAGPTVIPVAADRAEHWLDWWVLSWEPSYREVHLSDLRSVKDLADLAFDSGVQLGAGELSDNRPPALNSLATLEARLRTETSTIVDELLAGWRELSAPSRN